MDTGLLELAAFYWDAVECLSRDTVVIRPMLDKADTHFCLDDTEETLHSLPQHNSKRIRMLESIWIDSGKPTKILVQPDDCIVHWASRHPEVELWFYEPKFNYYFSGEKMHHVDSNCKRIPMEEVYECGEDDDDLPF